MIPVRCFTCGKVLGNLEKKWKRYQVTMTKAGALNKLGLKRRCCRTVMLTYVDVLQITLDYERMNSLKSPIDTSSQFVTVHTTKNRKFQPIPTPILEEPRAETMEPRQTKVTFAPDPVGKEDSNKDKEPPSIDNVTSYKRVILAI